MKFIEHIVNGFKVHKNSNDPPLRPIISMSGTVTHDVAQHINTIIQPYMNTQHVIKSSDELLLKLKNLQIQDGQKFSSLDVESLFTNVPVQRTIDIIIQTAYNHETLPAPTIPQETLRELLTICTTETPFSFNNKTYQQIDGVSMGSPLGPTMAEYYMSSLETFLLSQTKISNPLFYVRYVDDILTVFKCNNHIRHFINRLQNNSVLKFTSEQQQNNSFHFLDVQFTITENIIETSVYIKPTDRGMYSNFFFSHTLESYKISLIKTLVNRALKVSSSWISFDSEIQRLRRLFVDNGYPLFLIDKTINNMLNKVHTVATTESETNQNINLFVQLFHVSSFKSDENKLKSIIQHHVKPLDQNAKVSVKAYFRPYKLSSVFSTRPPKCNNNKSYVVYQFSCTEDRCNATYVGYTTNPLLTRCKQHRYSSSSIYSHYFINHSMSPPPAITLIENFKIIYESPELINLKIAEAITIKTTKPIINVKYNELYDFLKLF